LQLKNLNFTSGYSLALLLSLIVTAIAITALLIIIPGPGSDTSVFYSNWTINIAVMVAASISILPTAAAFRTIKALSKGKGYVPEYENKKYAIDKAKQNFYICLSLTTALTLWTLAELTWTLYQVGLHIENPFPSIADSFWLAGYPFIIYFTYGMNKALSKGRYYDREALLMLSVSAGLTLGYIFNLTFGVADMLSAAKGDMGWLISILYPILDTIALIPSLLLVASFRGRSDKSAYSIQWLLLFCSIIIVTIADIGFGYSEVLGKSEEQQWFWDTMYAASYIVMDGALITLVYSQYINAKPLKCTTH
jgi:hypothetical protein